MASQTVDRMKERIKKGGSIRQAFEVISLIPFAVAYPMYYLLLDKDKKEKVAENFNHHPLSTIPGMDSSPSLTVSAGYGAMVAMVLIFSLYVMGSWVLIPFIVIMPLSIVGGLFTIYLAYRRNMKRSLGKRLIITAIVGVVAGLTLLFSESLRAGSFPSFSASDWLIFMLFAASCTMPGAISGNMYVVKHGELEQQGKKNSEFGQDEGEQNTVTPSHYGEETGDKKGQKIIESLAEDNWTAPDDLPTNSKIKKTREINPLRDITRELWVNEKRYNHQVAKPEFSKEKQKYRTDVHNRDNNAPLGFSNATYNYILEDTVTEQRCGECGGHGTVGCAPCDSTGQTVCERCGGKGRELCPKCGGNMDIVETEVCRACGGDGVNQRGYTCRNCGGDGGFEKRATCPECSGQGEVSCRSCGGSGQESCDSCGGRGEFDCENCGTTGKIISFKTLSRTYSPSEEVSYRNKGIPEKFLEDADGTQIDKDRNNNPIKDGLYRREDETREIDVAVTDYEYAGNLWQAFDVEGNIKYVDYPRDYRRQTYILMGITVVVLPFFYLLWTG